MNQLTLLQRGVIKRLREARYHGLADLADDAWTHGEPCTATAVLSEHDADLRADFARANEKIRR